MQGSTTETSPVPALKEVLRGFNFLNVSKVFGKQNLPIMAMPLKRNQPRKKVTMPPLLMVDRSPSGQGPRLTLGWVLGEPDRSPSGPKKAGGSIRWKARRAKSVSAVSKDRGLSAVSGQNCFETRKLSLLWALRTLPGQSGGDKEYISTRTEHVSCICDVRRHLINEILWIVPKPYIQKSE